MNIRLFFFAVLLNMPGLQAMNIGNFADNPQETGPIAQINHKNDEREHRIEEFSYAVRDGNIDKVQELLDKNFDYAPLYLTAKFNQIRIAKLVMAHKKTDINRLDIYGDTALHTAAMEGHLEMCKLLLDHNADPKVRNVIQDTPCVTAIRCFNEPRLSQDSHKEIIKLLITAGKYKCYGELAGSDLITDPELLILLPMGATKCTQHSKKLIKYAIKSGIKRGDSKQMDSIFMQLATRETGVRRPRLPHDPSTQKLVGPVEKLSELSDNPDDEN